MVDKDWYSTLIDAWLDGMSEALARESEADRKKAEVPACFFTAPRLLPLLQTRRVSHSSTLLPATSLFINSFRSFWLV